MANKSQFGSIPSDESAYIGQEDWKAATNSEVFRGYLKIMAKKEQNEELLKAAINKAQEELEKQNKKVDDTKDQPEGVTQPLLQNLPYHKSSEEYDMIKNAFDELTGGNVETEIVEPEIVDESKAAPQKDICALYKTDAGKSDYIDIGVTKQTETLMENGIDYSTDEVMKPAIDETKVDESPVDESPVSDDEAIIEAEKALGLDKNINYILSKMGK